MKNLIAAAPTSSFKFTTEGQKAKLKSYTGTESTVVIPSSFEGLPVAGICSHAFSSDVPVHVSIPDSVDVIERAAFINCPNLRSISISSGTADIPGDFIIDSRSLERIDVSASNPNYKSLDGILYNKDMTILVRCPSAKTGELVIPDGVKVVEKSALMSCLALTRISIPSSTESADFCTHDSSLSPAALEEFCVAKDNPNYTSLDGILYSKDMTELLCCPNAKAGELVVPDSVTSIGDFAFALCTKIEKLTLPESVVNIGHTAFCFCEALTEINIPNGVTSLSNAFMKCRSLKSLTLPETITHINNFCFQECRSLAELKLPDSIEHIGDYAFSDCSGIAELTIPASVHHIGMDAFCRCIALEAINVDGENESFSSVDGVLYNKNQTLLIRCPAAKTGALAIPDGVRLIDKFAFDSCSGITELSIPASLTSVNNIVYSGCPSLKKLAVDENNSKLTAFDGMLMDKEMTTLLRCPPGRMGSVTVPDGVSTIGKGAFRDCGSITEITLPVGVAHILSGAFTDCTSLESANLPETLVSLGHYSFCRCSSLDELILPDSLEKIGLFTFSRCTAIITAPHAPDHYGYSPDSAVFWRISSL